MVCFFFNDTATTEIYTLSPTRRSSDLGSWQIALRIISWFLQPPLVIFWMSIPARSRSGGSTRLLASHMRSEEHTSELQSRQYLVCRLLLEKKKRQLVHAFYHAHTVDST